MSCRYITRCRHCGRTHQVDDPRRARAVALILLRNDALNVSHPCECTLEPHYKTVQDITIMPFDLDEAEVE